MRIRSRTRGLAILIMASAGGLALAKERGRKVWDQATATALVRPYVPDHLTVGEPLNRNLRGAKKVGLQTAMVILPVFPITAAPNQPEIKPNDTSGIINALCDVQLYIVGCSFMPNAATINCDSNGDGIDDVVIQLKDIQILNRNLVRVTIPALGPQLPGTAFPLSCCGGIASLTLIQHVGAGDDNVFGEFTQKTTCDIDLGLRAPVVLSSTPGGGNCATTQDLLIPYHFEQLFAGRLF